MKNNVLLLGGIGNNSLASEILVMVSGAMPLLPLNPGPFTPYILHIIDNIKDLENVGVGGSLHTSL